MRLLRVVLLLCSALSPLVLLSQETPSDQSAHPTSNDREQILARAADSTVLILAGEGAGRLQAVATGVIVRKDGVILTAYHAISTANEVQVRLKNGEIFDSVDLLGHDERRDVAALKIAARNLPALPVSPANEAKVGDAVYAVTHSGTLGLTARDGILSAMRPAREVPDAGEGYLLIECTASVSPAASGGALLGPTGAIIGIITHGNLQGTGFAVPIESVIGLTEETERTRLGNGAALRLPRRNDSPAATEVKSSNPQEIARAAKTIIIESRTQFFTPASLGRALGKEPKYPSLGLLIVQDGRLADLLVEIDRPLFTYHFTYTVTDKKTSIVLLSGKVTAFDGEIASGRIASTLVKEFVKLRAQQPSTPAQASEKKPEN